MTATTYLDALLADGTVVQIRPIEPADAEGLVRFHARLSPETVYLRFFSPHPTLSEREVARFTNVDHRDREALVATRHGEIIGVARFDREDGTDAAEAAFVVDDAWQERGVGSLLMEHLAERARAVGYARLTAATLPHNRRMLRVFAESGLGGTRRFDGDAIRVEIPLTPTAASAASQDKREHMSERRSVARVLEPSSVAVIGASDRLGTVGKALLDNVVDGGFAGPVYPVNPKRTELRGIQAFPTVADIPGPVDVAIVAVPAESVIAVAEDCARKGVNGLVVVSAGFAETGSEGAARQRQLVRVARDYGMRLIGPNCVGVINQSPSVRLNATFADVRPPAGHIAVMSQSGAIGIALLEAAARTGLGLSTFVSAGNKADVSGNDLLQYWEDDERTAVVLMYLESFGNPRKFSRLARRVSRTKPIIAVKSGRTDAGRRAASSHTAAMASSDDAVDALFGQTGVIRADTVREMFSVARVLATQPLPRGRRIAIVGNSGGPGILAADACVAARLDLPALGDDTLAKLLTLVPPGAGIANPCDLLASAGPAQYATAVETILADDDVDAVIVIFTPTLVADPDEVASAIVGAAKTSTKPVAAAFIADADGMMRVDGAAVPRFEAAEDAVHALGRVADYADWLRRPAGAVVSSSDAQRAGARALIDRVLGAAPEGRWLETAELAELLGAYDIAMEPTLAISSVDGAVAAAEEMGFPVALKVEGARFVHKADVGGVVLDIANETELRDAWGAITDRLGRELDAAVVQRMASAGVETIVGAVQDVQFGPLVMFGLGGAAAELLGDKVLRLVPLTDTEAGEMVRSLHASRLLFGYRNTPMADVGAVEMTLLRLAALVDDHPEIAEVDLNPVIVQPTGVSIVDAKVRVAPAARREPSTRQMRTSG